VESNSLALAVNLPAFRLVMGESPKYSVWVEILPCNKREKSFEVNQDDFLIPVVMSLMVENR
jgi:hypothetical protein